MTPQWAWATHQPLIQSAIDLYGPNYVLEIGVGLYSTPLFLDDFIEYKGIEQNELWINKVKQSHPSLDIEHHAVPFNSSFSYKNLTNKQIYEVVNYYSSLKQQIEEKRGPKLLFVDCFAATRLYAINTLWDLFDVVIFHDSHPRVFKVYGYDKIKVKYNKYQLTSNQAWTCICVKQDLGPITIRNNVNTFIAMFEKRWGVKSGMKLIEL